MMMEVNIKYSKSLSYFYLNVLFVVFFMAFARKHLEKYGWKEGKGLGKNDDGIAAVPSNTKLQFDNIGQNAQLTNKWWETLFNNATQNIDVQVEDETVNLALKAEPIEITTKSYSSKNSKKNTLSGGFVTPFKLTDKVVENFNVPVINENPKKIEELTDEQLFEACGGRTAHKGARHGLKLNGKLSRIEKQEKILLKKMKGVSLDDESKIIKKMKKLHLQKEKIETDDTNDSIEPVSDSSCSSIKKKKKLRKSVSFNDTVLEYYIPNVEVNNGAEGGPPVAEQADAVNSDEGIEQDIEDSNNQEDDNHRSFEEPQFIVSDLSNAERKKLKKKRKLEGKNRATTKFIQAVKDEMMEDISSNTCQCKKRKLNNAKCSERKRSQSETESPERLRKKHDKKKKHKDSKHKKFDKHLKSDDQKIKNIVMSLDNFCKISDDD